MSPQGERSRARCCGGLSDGEPSGSAREAGHRTVGERLRGVGASWAGGLRLRGGVVTRRRSGVGTGGSSSSVASQWTRPRGGRGSSTVRDREAGADLIRRMRSRPAVYRAKAPRRWRHGHGSGAGDAYGRRADDDETARGSERHGPPASARRARPCDLRGPAARLRPMASGETASRRRRRRRERERRAGDGPSRCALRAGVCCTAAPG